MRSCPEWSGQKETIWLQWPAWGPLCRGELTGGTAKGFGVLLGKKARQIVHEKWSENEGSAYEGLAKTNRTGVTHRATIIELLLYTRNCTVYNEHHLTDKEMGAQKLGDWPKGTQLVSGRALMQTWGYQHSRFKSKCLNVFAPIWKHRVSTSPR